MSALTNAIEILRCFSSARPDLSFADVMTLTGKPKSSTSRLLRQLWECGLLEQDLVTRRYRPGLLLFELGRLHRAENDFVAATEARLRAVCAATGHTGYIAVLDGAEQVVLRAVTGSNPLQVVTPPGVRAPDSELDRTGRRLPPPQGLRQALFRTTTERFHQAFHNLRRTFARLGVSVICARGGDPARLILERLDQLRLLERKR